MKMVIGVLLELVRNGPRIITPSNNPIINSVKTNKNGCAKISYIQIHLDQHQNV